MPEDPKNSPESKQQPASAGHAEIKPAIRTMKTDVEELLQKKRSSFTQIAGQEIAAHPNSPAPAPKPSIKTRLTQWGIRGLFGLFILLALAGIISLFISPVPRQTAKPEKIKLFFAAEKERDAVISSADKKSLARVLQSINSENARAGTITRLAITLEDGPSSRPPTLTDFFALLDIIPNSPTFLERIEGPIMPFFFHNGNGNRFGLATRTRDPARTLRDLILWEPTLANDLRPLFLNEHLQFPAQIAFEDKIFRNIDWRWLPLSQNTDLGLAYAVFSANQLMILTTNQSGMEAVLTRLLGIQ